MAAWGKLKTKYKKWILCDEIQLQSGIYIYLKFLILAFHNKNDRFIF